MSITSKYNKVVFNYVIPPTHEFITMSELYTINPSETYRLNGLYINKKGKFGDSPIAISDNFILNLPKHLLDTINAMLNDSEMIGFINDGMVGFSIYSYKPGFYSVKWCDL
ncbi:MAG: hypothetical protein ACRC5T_03170 [Cetobacterium sp.]